MSKFSQPERPDQWGDGILEHGQVRAWRIMRVCACLTLPLRRRRGGISSPGFDGGLAILALFCWAMMTHDLLCLYYLGAYLVALAFYRLSVDRGEFSLYEGRPYLELIVRNYALATALEPLAILALGFWMNARFPCLGLVFIVSGFACAANELFEHHQRRQAMIAYTDGQRMMEYQKRLYERAGRR